jgi:hypothetical protein
LARSTHHLLSMAKEFESLGVDLVATGGVFGEIL